MMVGLIQSGRPAGRMDGWIGLTVTAWAPYVRLFASHATYLQSTVRRFSRRLTHPRIRVHELYGTARPSGVRYTHGGRAYALSYLALDTTTLWGPIRGTDLGDLSGASRPVGLAGLDPAEHHGRLRPPPPPLPLPQPQRSIGPISSCLPWVVLPADRGFADVKLMGHLLALGWVGLALDHPHQAQLLSVWVYGPGRCRAGQVDPPGPARGQAKLWQGVFITEQRLGPVHLALARVEGSLWSRKGPEWCGKGSGRVDAHWFGGSSYQDRVELDQDGIGEGMGAGPPTAALGGLGPGAGPARASKRQERCPVHRSLSVEVVRYAC